MSRCIDEEHWIAACDASRKRASLLVKYNFSCTYSYFIHQLPSAGQFSIEISAFAEKKTLTILLNKFSSAFTLVFLYLWYMQRDDFAFIIIDEFDAFYHTDLSIAIIRKLVMEENIQCFSQGLVS